MHNTTQHNTTQRERLFVDDRFRSCHVATVTLLLFSVLLVHVDARGAWIATTWGYHVTPSRFIWGGDWGLSPGESFFDLRGEWCPTGTPRWQLGASRAYVNGLWEATASYVPGGLVDVRGYLDYIPVGWTYPRRRSSNVLQGI